MRRGCRLLLTDTTKKDGEGVGKSDKKRERVIDRSSCFYITTRLTTVGMLRLSM